MNQKYRTSLFRAPARILLALTTLGTIALPTLAANTGPTPQAAQSTTGPNVRSQDATLKVGYYAGDPQKGGKLIRTVTLTRPQRSQGHGQPAGTQDQAQTPRMPGGTTNQHASRPNPILDQAPKGATFAVILDAQGGPRTIDLAHPDIGHRGRGGMHQTDRTQTGGGAPTNR